MSEDAHASDNPRKPPAKQERVSAIDALDMETTVNYGTGQSVMLVKHLKRVKFGLAVESLEFLAFTKFDTKGVTYNWEKRCYE